MSGKQVLIGFETAQPDWEAAVVAAAATATSIVQDYVEPRTCTLPMLVEGSDEPHPLDVAPVLGPLLFNGHPAGIFTRFLADGSAGIVSLGNPRAADDCAVAV